MKIARYKCHVVRLARTWSGVRCQVSGGRSTPPLRPTTYHLPPITCHLHRRGLTLIELLASFAILAIIVALLAVTFNTVSDTWRSAQARTRVVAQGRAVMDTIAQDLRQAVATTNFPISVSNAVASYNSTNNWIEFLRLLPTAATNQYAIEAIRYELDRVLSASGKPISIQYDDRIDKQRLQGYEELYDAETQLLVSMTGGSYTWGVATPGNNGKPAAYGNAAYHFEMDQDYRPAIRGHQVSIDHLNIKGDNVTGEVKARLASKLGIQGDALTQGGSRISMPMVNSDSPTSDDYYANATMVNSVFQTEMSVTKGSVMVDADYKTFDSPDILNRNHVTLSITGGTNAPSNNAIIPKKAVVMGYEHRLNRKSAFTRILVRRGG